MNDTIRCRSPQIPCYHYILTLNSDTYPYCSNKIVVSIGVWDQGLRICDTQTTQLHTENPVDYTPVGQVIAPYVSLVAIFIAAIVIGYVTD